MRGSPESFRERQEMQAEMLRFYNSKWGNQTAWVDHGCADEFDRCWKSGMRNHDAIWECCMLAAGSGKRILETKARVGKIVT